MYTHILVPLDGSKRSELILPQVESVARQCGATVTFLEVVNSLPTQVAEEALDPPVAGTANRDTNANHYVQELAQQYQAKGIPAHALIKRGSVVDAILKTATSEGADLIAMASHAHEGFARVLYGSVAAGVLHRSRVPMLIVHAENDVMSLKR